MAKNSKELVKKFKKEILTILEKEVGETEKKKIQILIINDMAHPNCKNQILKHINQKETNLLPLSGVWQIFFDKKYALIEDMINSKIIHDTGLIFTLKCCLSLKENVIKKFDKYFVSLVLFGSWARGAARPNSDIDIGIIMDDTDIRDSTRLEVRDKIRNIVLGMSAELSKKLNVQVYLLTQFWENVRDANPVIFTLLRDGVPVYDRGLFSPWRLLLKMGKIKPTPEAIESFINSGNLLVKMVKSSVNELVVEKLYYAMLNPAQALLMHIGVAPPVYSETPTLLRKYFVSKKMLAEKYAKWLEELIELRKKVEHEGVQVDVKTFESYLKKVEEFSEVVNKLFLKLRNEIMAEKVKEIDFLCKKGMKSALDSIGIKVTEKNITNKFINEILSKEKLPPVYYDFINYFETVQEDYKKGLVTHDDVSKLEKNAHDFIEAVINFTKSRELKGTDKFKIRGKYKNKICEIWFLEKYAYIIKDVEHPEDGIIIAKVKKDGNLEKLRDDNISALDEKRKSVKLKEVATIKEETIESLKKILKEDVEILISE